MDTVELPHVANDMVVGLVYRLSLDDGQTVDQATAEAPLLYLHGHGNIIAGLESALTGMQVGDNQRVSIAPNDGYGVVDPEEVIEYPRTIFPESLALAPGLRLKMRDPKTDETFEAIVDNVSADSVVLDFNHPLAGETLHFNVTIDSVRPATASELAHGHAH